MGGFKKRICTRNPKWRWVLEKMPTSASREWQRFKPERKAGRREELPRQKGRKLRREWMHSTEVEEEQRKNLWCCSVSTVKIITSLWITIEEGMNGSSMSHDMSIIITESTRERIRWSVLISVTVANWSHGTFSEILFKLFCTFYTSSSIHKCRWKRKFPQESVQHFDRAEVWTLRKKRINLLQKVPSVILLWICCCAWDHCPVAQQLDNDSRILWWTEGFMVDSMPTRCKGPVAAK